MARRNLRKAECARQLGRTALMLGMRVGVHEDDGHAVDAGLASAAQLDFERGEIEMPLHRAVGAHTLIRLDDAAVQHLRLDDALGENVGTRLRADLQLVLEPAGDDQERRIALALEQRVGGDGGPHLHCADALRWDRRPRGHVEKQADGLQRRVVIGTGVLRQQLAGEDAAVGCACNDVGEGAAAVDPEVPLVVGRLPGHPHPLENSAALVSYRPAPPTSTERRVAAGHAEFPAFAGNFTERCRNLRFGPFMSPANIDKEMPWLGMQ